MATKGLAGKEVSLRWDGLYWRVVDKWGNSVTTSNGTPLTFESEKIALGFVAKKGMNLIQSN